MATLFTSPTSFATLMEKALGSFILAPTFFSHLYAIPNGKIHFYRLFQNRHSDHSSVSHDSIGRSVGWSVGNAFVKSQNLLENHHFLHVCCMSIHLLVCPPIILSVCPLFCPSVCPSIHPHISNHIV